MDVLEATASVWSLPLPPNPTDALPGTEEKMQVMERRVETGVAIFHPDDAVHDVG